MCAIPAADSAWLADATAPDVAGPITATSLRVGDHLLRDDETLAGALLDRRVAEDELHPEAERPRERRERVPRPRQLLLAEEAGAAVSGVMIPIFSVPLQLTACDRATVDEPAPAVDASAAATIVDERQHHSSASFHSVPSLVGSPRLRRRSADRCCDPSSSSAERVNCRSDRCDMSTGGVRTAPG